MEWEELKYSGKTTPEPRASFSFVRDGKCVYLFGGWFGQFQDRFLFNDVYILFLEDLSWRYLPCFGDKPSPRLGHAATVLFGRKILFGGTTHYQTFNDLYEMDLGLLIWRRLRPRNPAPEGRAGHSLCAIHKDARLIVFGGNAGAYDYNDVQIYDAFKNMWLTPACRGQIPSPRCYHSAVMINNDREMIVFGGWGGDSTRYNDINILDIETFTWREIRCAGSTPSPRHGHVGLMIDSRRMLVQSGGDAYKELGDTYILDLEHEHWERKDNIRNKFLPTQVSAAQGVIIPTDLFDMADADNGVAAALARRSENGDPVPFNHQRYEQEEGNIDDGSVYSRISPFSCGMLMFGGRSGTFFSGSLLLLKIPPSSVYRDDLSVMFETANNKKQYAESNRDLPDIETDSTDENSTEEDDKDDVNNKT